LEEEEEEEEEEGAEKGIESDSDLWKSGARGRDFASECRIIDSDGEAEIVDLLTPGGTGRGLLGTVIGMNGIGGWAGVWLKSGGG